MKKLTIVKAGSILFFTIVLITWFKSDKLSSYWQQEYENSELLTCLANTDIGKIGNSIGNMSVSEALDKDLIKLNQPLNTVVNKLFYSEEVDKSRLIEIKKQQEHLEAELESILQEEEKIQPEPEKPKTSTKMHLAADRKALFIGDSLMQGVAPWVMRKLQKDHMVSSINLSKHSTGLTVSKFFDWPATVETTLTQNPDVNTLFVFLGGNDGQSIIDPDTGRYIRFGTERWDEVYVGKIQMVLDIAQKHDVQVLWVTPPTMKREDLNQRTNHLSQLYHDYISETPTLVMYSKNILQSDTEGNEYSDSMLVDGKLIKVRTADGVHFTTTGQKMIANAIMENIEIDGTPMLSVTEPY